MKRTLLLHLAFWSYIKYALGGDIEDDRCQYEQNLIGSIITDSETSIYIQPIQEKGNLLYETKDPHEIQITFSGKNKHSSLSYGNIDNLPIDQSYIEPCETITYANLSNSVFTYEKESPSQYIYDIYNHKTAGTVLHNSTPSRDTNHDEIQYSSTNTYQNIITSQSQIDSDFVSINDKSTIMNNNFDSNSTASYLLQCNENGVNCLCFSVDTSLQSKTSFSADSVVKETLHLSQESLETSKSQTFEYSSCPVLDHVSSHQNTNNTGDVLFQKKNFGIKAISKKRKFNECKSHQSQSIRLFGDLRSETLKINEKRRLVENKSTKSTDKKKQIQIKRSAGNLHYYEYSLEKPESEKINILNLKEQNHLEYLKDNQILLQNLYSKTVKLFGEQNMQTLRGIKKIENFFNEMLIIKQNKSDITFKPRQNFLDSNNFLFVDLRENNFVKQLYLSKNDERKGKKMNIKRKLTINLIKEHEKLTFKKIALLENAVNINCDLNVCKKNLSNTNSYFKCQNGSLNSVITEIFYLFCQNTYNGDEGCIIKFSLFVKILQFYELPKFLDLVFLTDYNIQTTNIDEIILVLNSFLKISKLLTDANFIINDLNFIFEARLHVLQYLKLLYGKSSTFAVYSHLMAHYNNLKELRPMSIHNTAILYFSFFILSYEYEDCTGLSFFYSDNWSFFFVRNRVDNLGYLLYHLIHHKKDFVFFMISFNEYILKCLCNCGFKFSEYKKSYYLFVGSKKVAFFEENENYIDNYFYELCGFPDFIHKLINCYFETIKRYSEFF